MENFRRKWNLDCITVTKILKCFRTNWCRKRRKTFNTEIFVVLAEYFEQQTDSNRYRKRISKWRRSTWWKGISRIYISLSKKWKPCHGAINSRPRNFKNGTEKVLSITLKLETTTGWSEEQYAKSVRLKSKWQRINTITLYLRDISTPLVGVVFEHIDQI